MPPGWTRETECIAWLRTASPARAPPGTVGGRADVHGRSAESPRLTLCYPPEGIGRSSRPGLRSRTARPRVRPQRPLLVPAPERKVTQNGDLPRLRPHTAETSPAWDQPATTRPNCSAGVAARGRWTNAPATYDPPTNHALKADAHPAAANYTSTRLRTVSHHRGVQRGPRGRGVPALARSIAA
jgi:hypothetical protein